MPPGCCISRDAFVLVKLIGLDQCINPSGGIPVLYLGSDACAPCTQYITVSNIYPNFTEMCSLSTNPFWISVDADCCDPTPTRPNSWGRLKTMYR